MRKLCLSAVFVLAIALAAAPLLAENVVYPQDFPPKVLQSGGGLTNVVAPSDSGSGKSPSLSGNIVTFNSGTVNFVIGAVNANDMDVVEGNQVFIKGGTVDKAVWGAYCESCNVVGNSVTVSGGSGMNEDVMGGYSNNGGAMNNSVTVTGGSINMPVYGGLAGGHATGNTVTISGGTLMVGVAGGSSDSGGDATGNTVIINGAPTFVAGYEIYGGTSWGGGDEFHGNTLEFGTSIPITVEIVANFEHYEFSIPASVGNGGTVLTVTDPVDLSGTTLDITGTGKVKNGNTITLISNVIGTPNTIHGAPYVPDADIVTSSGTWRFSIAGGALTATAVSVPSSGGGGGGGCNVSGDNYGGVSGALFCLLALAALGVYRRVRA